MIINYIFYILLSVFSLFSLVIFISSFKNTIPRKIGFRNIKRRLGNTFLVVIGSLVGAALISGSLVLYDSLDYTFSSLADEMVGETDLLINLKSKNIIEKNIESIDEQEFKKLENKLDINEIDGVLPYLKLNTSPVKIDENNKPLINEYNISLYGVDFDKLYDFGQNPQNYLKQTKENQVIVSNSLAKKLELEKQDKLQIRFGKDFIKLKVIEIYEDQGILGGPAILVSNSFLSEKLGFKDNQYNEIAVSAKGPVKPENYKGEIFKQKIKDDLDNFEFNDYVITFQEIKQNVLEGYGLKMFSIFFLALSSFGIFAGILLMANLYSMLAQERKKEMGILRAIALTRADLVKSFVYEGFLYSILSSIAGAFLGVGIGYFLIKMLGKIFSQEGLTVGLWLKIRFNYEFRSLIIAFCAGFIITILTSFFASYKNSKLNIVSAIRGLAPQESRKVSGKWIFKLIFHLILLAIGLLLLVNSSQIQDQMQQIKDQENSPLVEMPEKLYEQQVTAYEAMMIYFGTVLSSFMLSFIINRLIKQYVPKGWKYSKYIISFAAIFNIVFTANMTNFEAVKETLKVNMGAVLFLASGLVLVISSAILAAQNLNLITMPITWIFNKFGKIKSIFKLAFRYPSENSSHTNRTLIMFAIIMYLIIFITIEQAIINVQIKDDLKNSIGGYDLIVQPEQDNGIEGVKQIKNKIKQVDNVNKAEIVSQTLVSLPEFKYKDLAESELYGDPGLIPEHNLEDSFFSYYNAMTPEYLKNAEIELQEKLHEYENDKDVWQTVINDSDKIVIGEAFLRMGYGQQPDLQVGDFIEIANKFGDKKEKKQIIGAVEVSEDGGEIGYSMTAHLITSQNHLKNQFSQNYINQFSTRNVLAKYDNNVDKQNVTNQIKKSIIKFNIKNITSLQQLIERTMTFMDTFIYMFNGFLAFSLIVGSSGLAIIITRAVNERRQQIGMLRSLGFSRKMILFNFFIESTLISSLGILIGVGMAIIGVDIAFTQVFDMEVIIPVKNIFVICSIVYGASMLFSIFPAVKAARMSPVEATNYPE